MDIITKLEILLADNGYNKESLECDGVGDVYITYSHGTEIVRISKELGCINE